MKKIPFNTTALSIRYSLLLIFVCVFCIAFANHFFTNSKAQVSSKTPSEPAMSGELNEAFTKLIETAQQKGTVRVIIGLRVDFKAEGELSEFQRLKQRDDIKQAQAGFLNRLQSYYVAEVKQFDYIPFLAAEVDVTALQKIQTDPQISSIQEDEAVAPTLAQSTSLVQAPAAWSAGFSGSGWAVAILDTGVDKNHPFLSGKVVSEACYSSNVAGVASSVCPGGVTQSTASNSGLNCSLSINGCNHGTHVAGIAAGRGTSFSGVAKDANIIAVQVFSRFDNCGSSPSPCARTYQSDQVLGLERVMTLRSTMNIAAVNMSLGGGQYFSNCDTVYSPEKAAIDNLRSVGIATVISSGNESYTNSMGFPACISTAVSVGSTDDGSSGTTANAVSSFSNSASFLHLLAPGRWIDSSVPGGGYDDFAGTSMAAPHVAGAWAVLKQRVPNASVTQVLNALTSTGLPVTDPRNSITKPRIRINDALQALGAGGNCPAPTSIAIGQTINGTLTASDCINGDRYYVAYTFSGTANQQIAISQNSTAFDTYLYLLNSSGTVIAEDDDGGGGTNSRIPATSGFFTLPATGVYTIRASSYTAGATGAYSLTLTANGGAGCTYQGTPASNSVASGANSSSFQVTTQTGCSWTATVNAPQSFGNISLFQQNLLSLISDYKSHDASANAQAAPEAVFSNSFPITINDRTSTGPPATASLYPSNITVSGMTGTITQVKATLNGFSHSFPDDADILLVGPGGQRTILMSDAGGNTAVSAVNLTFDQNAATTLPDTSAIASGSYRPGNYAGNATLEPGGADNFPSPGPGQTSYNASLSVFNGTAPNGTWQLYVVDDESQDAGNIAGGWTLEITTSGGTSTWLTVNAPTSGTGSATISYSFTANTGATQRTGQILINGQVVHTVVQAPTGGATVRSRSDFDGDGKTDYAVFRAGYWYVQRASGGFLGAQWGAPTDQLMPGDFDGDGKTDFATYRSTATGGTNFYVILSQTLTYRGANWGITGDIARSGDFDGDGKDDLAVYRPSTLTYYALPTAGGATIIQQIGQTGDIPIVMKIDGDTKSDFGVFRPSNNTWYVRRSTDGVLFSFQLGQSGDVLVPADYDNDNQDDVAVFRSGTWIVRRSTDGQVISANHGQAGDIPAPGDYDGDGKDDYAVFRAGSWYISLPGSTPVAFGIAGDVPIPRAYFP